MNTVRRHRFAHLSALAIVHACAALTHGQLAVDPSLGTSVSRLGNDLRITGGTRPGNGPNLFHSFSDFNVKAGESATFTDTATGISNVLSRVTGGKQSNLNGIIRTEGSLRNANLY